MDLRNRQKAGERGKKSPLEEDWTCNPSAGLSCIVDAVFSLPHLRLLTALRFWDPRLRAWRMGHF